MSVLTKRTCSLPLICQICGDKARGINFDVMTCMSCKAFFRRHALQSKTFHCQLDDNCQITRITRSACTSCRLKKCFLLGMNSKLIRNPSKPIRRNSNKNNQLVLPLPKPINLLANDSSTLTKFEWNLLSNILHAYDKNQAKENTRILLEQQLALPPKLRSKSTITLDIVGYFYSTTQSFIQCIPFFNELAIEGRRAVIQHNSDTTGTLNSLFLVRETNALDSPAYVMGCCNIYGEENFLETKKFVSELEQNGVLFKIMLLIIAFAGNCSIVVPNHVEDLLTIKSTIALNRIQNVLVTMLWKYLLYQYGYVGAIKCFNSYIKFILNILRWTNERFTAQHWGMVDTMVENTARLLTIEDPVMD